MRSLLRQPLVLVLILIGVSSLPARAGDTALSPDLTEQLENLFLEWDRLDRPGGSVAVVQNGDVIFQRSYGLASMELRVPNSDQTLYDITALAEVFTATAVASLIAEGRIALDDPVGNHLPELAAIDPSIRVGHLVYHLSGLWDWSDAWQLSGGYLADVITIDQILGLLRRQSEPTFEPGSRFSHCTSNYTLLAEIATRVAGEPFGDWLWVHVLRPAGMTRSLVRGRSGESVEGSAEAYDYVRLEGYRRGTVNLAAPGSHGVYATIENMATWLIQLDASISGGSRPPGLLLDSGVLSDGTPVAFVHGLHRDTYHGRPRWHAEGNWQGFNSALQYLPDEHLGVIILCNWVSNWVNPVGQCTQIVDLLLGTETAEEDRPPAPADHPSAETSAVDFTPDPTRYGQLTGDYRWEPGDVFGVVQQGDRLAYQVARFRVSMTELAQDRFTLDGYPYVFTFSRDGEGRATSCLIEHEGDPAITAPRIDLVQPGPDDLEALVGEYHSPELDAEYSVLVVDGNLCLSHRRRGLTELEPEAADHFTATSPAFRLLEFLRDEQGRVSGFRVDTMNLVFQRRF